MDQHTKSVGITLAEFNAAYQPERSADGSYRQREWTVAEDAAAITAAHAERRAWTMLDEDVVVSGVARANRSFYIITAHPYIEGERIEVSAAAPDLASIGATIAAAVGGRDCGDGVVFFCETDADNPSTEVAYGEVMGVVDADDGTVTVSVLWRNEEGEVVDGVDVAQDLDPSDHDSIAAAVVRATEWGAA
jgi:hypothetical protein